MTFNFCGQALDNLWICLSNLCPSVLELDRGSTVLGLYLDSASTNPLHDLFLDGHWTGNGQGLDKHWILRSISVQPTIGQLYPKIQMRECRQVDRIEKEAVRHGQLWDSWFEVN